MLSESFITSIRAEHKSANTSIKKDVGIYLHELHPDHTIKSSFKKSSTPVNALVATSTHIYASQADKAVVHVYTREGGNQAVLVPFPERIHTLTLIGDGVLALGTAEGSIHLWEVGTGRQISTPASHLQAVSCLAATQCHLASGSEDSNIHVWSIPKLLSWTNTDPHEPIRSLSNHRAAITSILMGHGSSSTNICVSASKDNTVIVWNYESGDLLRTFLLPSTPLCLALDPCDRAVYAGFQDGSLQVIEFHQADSKLNPLYDTRLQATPVQVTSSPWTVPSDSDVAADSKTGSVLCLDLNYDGTVLISGHSSGKVVQWDTGKRAFATELTDLNAPVTNLLMLSPFPTKRLTKLTSVVKPNTKVKEGNYTLTTQLTRAFGADSSFERAVQAQGFPSELLNDAISRFSGPVGTVPSAGEEKLRQENEELWKVVNQQRALLKKNPKLKSGGS